MPIWPMNAVSTKEAIGSAVKARAAGNAIDAISTPSLSNLRACLLIQQIKYYKILQISTQKPKYIHKTDIIKTIIRSSTGRP